MENMICQGEIRKSFCLQKEPALHKKGVGVAEKGELDSLELNPPQMKQILRMKKKI